MTKKKSNTNLLQAKKAKNDEFYTRYDDIEKEISHYWDHLKGKWVYSPCDDYRWSEFKNYFVTNFSAIGLSHYTCTNYDLGDGAYRYDYDGEKESITPLEGNGDFRSEECIEFLKESDVVVTNPPFSLFREYIKQLMDYGKKFIIIGSGNAVTYKEIFPLIKDNKIWMGASKGIGGKFLFEVPSSYNGKFVSVIDGKRIAQVNSACWFTNIPHEKRNTPIRLFAKYTEEDYPKYDNYDAIEVGKTKDIPCDYDGVMGVPITFLDKYCSEQFEIVGNLHPVIGGKHLYTRILIRKKQ